jgi:hypothetical protein
MLDVRGQLLYADGCLCVINLISFWFNLRRFCAIRAQNTLNVKNVFFSKTATEIARPMPDGQKGIGLQTGCDL